MKKSFCCLVVGILTTTVEGGCRFSMQCLSGDNNKDMDRLLDNEGDENSDSGYVALRVRKGSTVREQSEESFRVACAPGAHQMPVNDVSDLAVENGELYPAGVDPSNFVAADNDDLWKPLTRPVGVDPSNFVAADNDDLRKPLTRPAGEDSANFVAVNDGDLRKPLTRPVGGDSANFVAADNDDLHPVGEDSANFVKVYSLRLLYALGRIHTEFKVRMDEDDENIVRIWSAVDLAVQAAVKQHPDVEDLLSWGKEYEATLPGVEDLQISLDSASKVGPMNVFSRVEQLLRMFEAQRSILSPKNGTTSLFGSRYEKGEQQTPQNDFFVFKEFLDTSAKPDKAIAHAAIFAHHGMSSFKSGDTLEKKISEIAGFYLETAKAFFGKNRGGFVGKKRKIRPAAGGQERKNRGGFVGKNRGGFVGKNRGGFVGKNRGGFVGKKRKIRAAGQERKHRGRRHTKRRRPGRPNSKQPGSGRR